MKMIFEMIKSEGLAHFSYVVGDEQAGMCAVIDPRRDIEVYMDIARANNARITHILETHIHADFVSGSRELANSCGANIGDRKNSTIGYERGNNPVLQIQEEGQFVAQVLSSLEPAPSYYSRMKKINAEGPPVLKSWPELQPLDAGTFEEEMNKPDTVVIDTREIEAFGGAHIAGSINIGLREIFPIWAGRVLDESFPIWTGRMIAPDSRILLVLPDESRADILVRHLLRVGVENLAGYLGRGMRGWIESGRPFKRIPQLSVHELKKRIDAQDTLQVLDVRSEGEWREGYIATAQHIYVPDLNEKMERLDRSQTVAVYCGSGYRASIAASILEQHGFAGEIFNQLRIIKRNSHLGKW